MKLRNKNTGEVWDIPKMRHPTCQEDDISFFVVQGGVGKLFSYHSIAELNADWEDYKPAEPLIKDEKIRKAVRAWAEVNEFEPRYSVRYCSSTYTLTSWQASIEFNCSVKDLEDEKEYTIAELCGEEVE